MAFQSSLAVTMAQAFQSSLAVTMAQILISIIKSGGDPHYTRGLFVHFWNSSEVTAISFLKVRCSQPLRQVAKSVTSPLLDSEMGVIFVGFWTCFRGFSQALLALQTIPSRQFALGEMSSDWLILEIH